MKIRLAFFLLCLISSSSAVGQKQSLYFPLPNYQSPNPGFGYIPGNNLWPNCFHNGNDYACSYNTPVYAADKGLVSKVITNMTNTYPNHYTWGNMVQLDHPTGLRTIYAHLSAVYVRTGQFVQVGEKIGAVGNSGYSTGSHLHFEVRTGAARYSMGRAVDPYQGLWVSSPPALACRQEIIRESQQMVNETVQAIKRLFPIAPALTNPFAQDFYLKYCSIPDLADNINCMPFISFEFSQPVYIGEIRKCFFIEPEPVVSYLIFDYQEDRSKVTLSGFLLSANQRYRIGFENLTSTDYERMTDWQISFTTGDWPHCPINRFSHQIVVQKELVHLGNNIYEGPINQGFERRSQGREWSANFRLNEVTQPTVMTLNLRGAEGSFVELNGQIIGRLENSQNDNNQTAEISLPTEVLRQNINSLRIFSRENEDGDIDDFEFWNLTICY